MPVSEQQFRKLWDAMGNMLWAALQPESAKPEPAEPAKAQGEVSTTAAQVSSSWQPAHRVPVNAAAFGFGPNLPPEAGP